MINFTLGPFRQGFTEEYDLNCALKAKKKVDVSKNFSHREHQKGIETWKNMMYIEPAYIQE